MKQIKIMFICIEIEVLLAILYICYRCAKDSIFNYEHAILISIFAICLPVLHSLQQNINWHNKKD